MLPSEFKSQYESLVTKTIPSSLMNFLGNPYLFMNIVQELFRLTQQLTKQQVDAVNLRVMGALGLGQDQHNAYMQSIMKLY